MKSGVVRYASLAAAAAGVAIAAWGMPALAQSRIPGATHAWVSAPQPSGLSLPSASMQVVLPASLGTFTVPEGRCVEQAPQPFLVRGNWFKSGPSLPQMLQQAIKYRTEKYGYFHGFGKPEWNAHAPGHYAVATTFMGLPIQVNKRVVAALHCAEQALVATGATKAYKPRGIGGIRFHNTYRGGEVSNHVYGIAMDMDSEENTCCGCVGKWAKHPLCNKKVASVYERTKVPPIWVGVMERYGWYWLGNDVLQDTMHFEFLGDPDKIVAPTP